MKGEWRRKAVGAAFRERHKQKQRTVRAARSTAAYAINMFRSEIAQGPVYTCVSCHRHLYKQSVVKFVQSKFKLACQQMLTEMINAFETESSDLFICRTCKSYVGRVQLPPQAAINGLLLHDVPPQLQLTELEEALVAQRVLFMRVLALPRGRQRAIHGAVVNVPSDVSSTVSVLPQTPGHAGLIALKLKRRLRYKGYVLQQFVRPKFVLRAVEWLTANNPLYSAISVDRHWNECCLEEDEDTWRGMTGSVAEELPAQQVTHESDVEPSSNEESVTEELPAEQVTHDSDVEPSSSDHSSDSDDGDDELVEKVRGLKFSTSLQPCDPQYAATELSVAPAEGQTPLDFMLDTNAEVLAFPAKFPEGTGGLSNKRAVTVTPKKYFIQRVLNADKRFARDASYLFYAQYVTEMKQIRDNISVAMRMTAGRLSASTVSSAEQLRQLIRNDRAFQFLKNVRGSPAYFQRAVRELIAMVAQIGCPHFFLTLSAADMRWPELFKIIAQQNGDTLTDDDIAALTYEQKATMLRNDPVLAARHFDHRVRSFFSHVLVRGSVLGPIKQYFYRIEFQMRGSPHAHCLIWTEDGPDMATASASQIEGYFAGKVTGQLPADSDDLHSVVSQVQRHTHSVACRKGKNKQSCRFSFPQPPCDRTIVLAIPPSDEQNTKAMQQWRGSICLLYTSPSPRDS